MSEGSHTAVVKQLVASYEFLFHKLGPDHPEVWDCWQQYQRAIRLARSTS